MEGRRYTRAIIRAGFSLVLSATVLWFVDVLVLKQLGLEESEKLYILTMSGLTLYGVGWRLSR